VQCLLRLDTQIGCTEDDPVSSKDCEILMKLVYQALRKISFSVVRVTKLRYASGEKSDFGRPAMESRRRAWMEADVSKTVSGTELARQRIVGSFSPWVANHDCSPRRQAPVASPGPREVIQVRQPRHSRSARQQAGLRKVGRSNTVVIVEKLGRDSGFREDESTVS
jgi:hypothetical protein